MYLNDILTIFWDHDIQGVPWKLIAIVFVLVCSCSFLIIFLRIYFWKVYKEVLSYCPWPDCSVIWSHGHNLNTFQHQVALMVLSNFLIMSNLITFYDLKWFSNTKKGLPSYLVQKVLRSIYIFSVSFLKILIFLW